MYLSLLKILAAALLDHIGVIKIHKRVIKIWLFLNASLAGRFLDLAFYCLLDLATQIGKKACHFVNILTKNYKIINKKNAKL